MDIYSEKYDAYTVRFYKYSNIQEKPLWTLYLMNEIDLPILNNERQILFSSSKSKLHSLVAHSPLAITKIEDNGFECNPCEAVLLLSNGGIDEKSTILNCLNTFIDFLNAIQVPIKNDDYQNIKKCADFLTFNNNIDEMFEVEELDKKSIISFIECGIDTIMNSSIIYED